MIDDSISERSIHSQFNFIIKSLFKLPTFPLTNTLLYSTCQNRSTDKPEFRGSQWDLIRAGASHGAENNETDCYNELPGVQETCALIDSVAEILKQD